MPGLHLNVNGGVSAYPGNGFSSAGNGASATAKAFGQSYSDSGSPSTLSALTPNDPFGIAFWGGVACVVLLVVIRHSLPG